MDATLVGEGRSTDVRLVVVRRLVGDLGDRPRELGEGRQVAAARGRERELRLEGQVGEDADHVRVPAALAIAVDRRLDVADAGLDRGDRVGDRELGVVVGVDAPGQRRDRAVAALDGRPRLADDLDELSCQGAAIRVAQDERAGAARHRRAKRRERVLAIGSVAVEEVLRVVHELAALVDDQADALGDHVEILLRARAQDLDHVQQPALAEDRHDRRLGPDQLTQVRVGLGLVRAMARRAEGGELRRPPRGLPGEPEELDILRVRPRPATLHVRQPVLVEDPGHPELVGE